MKGSSRHCINMGQIALVCFSSRSIHGFLSLRNGSHLDSTCTVITSCQVIVLSSCSCLLVHWSCCWTFCVQHWDVSGDGGTSQVMVSQGGSYLVCSRNNESVFKAFEYTGKDCIDTFRKYGFWISIQTSFWVQYSSVWQLSWGNSMKSLGWQAEHLDWAE